MPKTRQQKEALLAQISDRIQRAQSVVFVGVTGVKVDEAEQMRDAFHKDGVQLQVAKNSLLKIALAEAKVEVPSELLDQPLALVFSYDDPIAGPKLVSPFLKDVAAMQILGGISDGAFITAAQVSALSKLPSREQLLGQLVGTLNAPISGLVNVLAGNIRGLVNVLGAIRDQKPA